MNIYLKYSLIALGVALPLGIQLAVHSGFADIVIALVPGFFIAILIQLFDLNKTFQTTSNSPKRVGKHNIQDDFVALSQSLKSIDASGDDIFAESALGVIKQMRQQLDSMAGGIIDVRQDVELSNLPTELMSEVQSTVCATLFWREDTLREGRRQSYNDAMTEAIERRKVRVQRLFILPDDEKIEGRALERIRQDIAANVEVKIISETSWGRKGDSPVDFGIWDGKKAWIFRNLIDGHRTAFVTTRVADIQKYERLFKAKWIDGKSFQV